MNKTEQQILDLINTNTSGTLWRPVRPLVAKALSQNQELVDRLQSIQQQTSTNTSSTPTTPNTPKPYGAVPRHVTDVLVTESPIRQNDRMFSLVSVQFTRNPRDRAYAGVKIWFTGYKGNPNPVLMVDASDSPVSFLAETTGETVVVTVQSVGAAGASPSFAQAPTGSVVLDGVTSAPPAPSLAQVKTATAVGWQFQFRFLTNLPTDVVEGYWIYRTDTHAEPGPSARYKFVKHATTGANLYTFQDTTADTFYYYVSAVNQAGQESSLTDAEGGGGGTGTVTSYSPSVGSGTFFDVAKAYNNNNADYALGNVTSYAPSKTATWSGFAPELAMPSAVDLKVLSEFVTANSGEHVTVEYSLDNGLSWATLYTFTNGTRVKTVDTASLSATQDLTQVQVKATITSGAYGGYQRIYEVWIETTL
jgi:hypothetical protein